MPLFNHCPDDDLDHAASLLRCQLAPPSTRFTAIELAANTYLVVSGEARGRPPHALGHGDLFGLLGFTVDDAPDAVTTLTATQLLVADESASTQLLRIEGVAQALVHGAAGRQRARIEVGRLSDDPNTPPPRRELQP